MADLEDYSWVTQELFDEELAWIVQDEGRNGTLISVPGIYEVVSEHFNDAVLKNLSDRRKVKGS